jgi:hypothetical protein
LSFVGFSQGLESQIMSSNTFDNSVHPHFGDDEERFLDLKSEALVQSLALDLFSILNIGKFPRLGLRAILFPYLNVGSFFIFASFNIKNLLVLNIVEVVFTIPLEELEPS